MTKFLIPIFLFFLVSSCLKPNGDTNNTMKPTRDSLHVEKSQIKHAITERINDTILLATYTELDPVFDSLNFHLEEVRKTDTVPRIFLLDIRKSLGQENSNVRKYDFLRVILSNSLLVNEQILKDRHFVISVQNQENLSREDSLQLSKLKSHYRSKTKAELIEKVDIVPPSLILCQSIIESGWGQSHFAYEGNSLFGEHAPADSKNAMKAKGANIGLRAFPTIADAIAGYAANLNRHSAYASLRKERRKLREENQEIDGLTLANTEEHYSELGHEYVEYLRKIISIYHLTDFDNCILEHGNNLFIEIEH